MRLCICLETCLLSSRLMSIVLRPSPGWLTLCQCYLKMHAVGEGPGATLRALRHSVQLLSRVQLFETPWTAARQASLSITNSRSLCKLMSIESVMPSNRLILCRHLLLLPSIFPSIRVFSNESVLCIRWPRYWSFSFSISPFNEYSGLISFRIDWLDLLAVLGTSKNLLQHHSSKVSILWHSAFFTVQLSHPYMTTGKTVRRVSAPRFFVSSQQRFGVMDIKAPWAGALRSWTDRVIALREISVTVQCYSSILFRREQENSSSRHEGTSIQRCKEKSTPLHGRERERERGYAHRRRGGGERACAWLLLLYVFSPLGLSYANRA